MCFGRDVKERDFLFKLMGVVLLLVGKNLIFSLLVEL